MVKRKVIAGFIFLMMLAFSFIPSFATSSNTQGVYNTNSTLKEIEADTARIQKDGGVPNVTMDDTKNWIERKGFDVISLLQKFGQPFSITIFIVCAFIALIGAFGNSQLIGRGILGMVIAILMYAVVLYAPEIMDAGLAWLAS